MQTRFKSVLWVIYQFHYIINHLSPTTFSSMSNSLPIKNEKKYYFVNEKKHTYANQQKFVLFPVIDSWGKLPSGLHFF